jgi:hypothetical protein
MRARVLANPRSARRRRLTARAAGDGSLGQALGDGLLRGVFGRLNGLLSTRVGANHAWPAIEPACVALASVYVWGGAF